MAECLPVQVATVTEPLEGGPEITGVGYDSSDNVVASLTLNLSVQAGLLVVSVELFHNTITPSLPTVTCDGDAMTLATGIINANGTHRSSVHFFFKEVTAGSRVVLITPVVSSQIHCQAWIIEGLVNKTLNASSTSSGTTEPIPTTGSITTTVAATAIIAVFATDHNSMETFVWGGGFVAGSQQRIFTIADTIASSEGRQIASIASSYEASITPSGGNHIAWTAALVAFS